jgi:hypothetical protein
LNIEQPSQEAAGSPELVALIPVIPATLRACIVRKPLMILSCEDFLSLAQDELAS